MVLGIFKNLTNIKEDAGLQVLEWDTEKQYIMILIPESNLWKY